MQAQKIHHGVRYASFSSIVNCVFMTAHIVLTLAKNPSELCWYSKVPIGSTPPGVAVNRCRMSLMSCQKMPYRRCLHFQQTSTHKKIKANSAYISLSKELHSLLRSKLLKLIRVNIIAMTKVVRNCMPKFRLDHSYRIFDVISMSFIHNDVTN